MICEKGIASLMVERDSFDAIKLLDDKSGDGNCFKMLVGEIWRVEEKFHLCYETYKVIVSRLFYDGQQQDFLYEFDLFASFLS